MFIPLSLGWESRALAGVEATRSGVLRRWVAPPSHHEPSHTRHQDCILWWGAWPHCRAQLTTRSFPASATTYLATTNPHCEYPGTEADQLIRFGLWVARSRACLVLPTPEGWRQCGSWSCSPSLWEVRGTITSWGSGAMTWLLQQWSYPAILGNTLLPSLVPRWAGTSGQGCPECLLQILDLWLISYMCKENHIPSLGLGSSHMNWGCQFWIHEIFVRLYVNDSCELPKYFWHPYQLIIAT